MLTSVHVQDHRFAARGAELAWRVGLSLLLPSVAALEGPFRLRGPPFVNGLDFPRNDYIG